MHLALNPDVGRYVTSRPGSHEETFSADHTRHHRGNKKAKKLLFPFYHVNNWPFTAYRRCAGSL